MAVFTNCEVLVPLTVLEPGQVATLAAVNLDGLDRSRLVGLGLVPGSRIECAFPSPMGDPVAYRVRGALIALRRQQAERILVRVPQLTTSKLRSPERGEVER